MYAVIKTGGKQYRVQKGDVIEVEHLAGENGEEVNLSEVLYVADGDQQWLGHPVLQGSFVKGKILAQDKAKKVIIYKYKRRKRYYRKAGHRQTFTRLEITNIQIPSGV